MPVGGTGVYNTYRFGENFDIQASMHGNMMQTRDFTKAMATDVKFSECNARLSLSLH